MTSQRHDVIAPYRPHAGPSPFHRLPRPVVHRAPRAKAAATDRSISDLVGEAVRLTPAEDADDLSTLRHRVNEPDLDFEKVVQSLKRRGKL